LQEAPEYVSDLLVDVMRRLGIEFVALNPGATTCPLHDSLVQYGGDHPQMVLCCHEEVAVAIADGYAKIKGKPMAVMLHDIVGLQHATKTIFESWLKNVPMLIIGGTGPLDVEKRRPWIDWIHTARMNANLIRGYVKWDDEPCDVTGAVDSLLRGYNVTATPPMGPVYLCYDILLQEQKLGSKVNLPNIERFRAPTPPQMDEESLGKVAKHLVEAKNPAIVTEYSGRDPKTFSHLVNLAELLSIPVIDKDECLNFPNTHELDVTGAEEEILKDADLVLCIDLRDIEHGLTSRGKGGARGRRTKVSLVQESATIVQIGLEHYSISGWCTNYRKLWPVDLSVSADSAVAVPALVSKCKEIMGHSMEGLREERRRYAAGIHKRLRDAWQEQARKVWNAKPISTARLASELWKLISKENWFLGHGSLNGWVRKLWTLDDPRRYIDPGISTGSGLGISIGMALAVNEPGSLYLSIVGDGDMLYTPSSLWTAANLKVPMLVIMYNNRSYYQDVGHQLEIARERNRDPSKVLLGTGLSAPVTDFAQLARVFSLNGVGPIEEPNELSEALQTGLRLVKQEGKLALVDVVTQPR
jgi:thiamine pyrophosphate-dependent acetolactate synthase large subunit-like protein